ncbi:hypothetical protein [Lishizhenia sp.]|uniref:hypothetical protein n=1 Tax=Lishizhenia sp. TaxID=2497594 RepID=UPI00299F136E|nr:hypothetical protein [Lishizhenia sp.]MDX1444972.1 hypothetical protein [Lishizhenia sp.]
MKNAIVSEGFSMNYLIPGMIALVGGVICVTFEPMITVIGVPIALFLLLIKTGVEVNFTKSKIRSYKSVFGIKLGLWNTFEKDTTGILRYTRSAAQMSSRGSSTTVRSETFDFNLLDKMGKEIQIHEFTQYQIARKLLKILEANTGMNIIDEFRETQIKAISKRQM